MNNQSTTYEVLFYDGGCGLCHRIVKFILKRDPAGLFHFAPMDGTYYQQHFSESVRQKFSEKVVLILTDGRVLVGTTAILHIFTKLNQPWTLIAPALRLIPRAIRDGVYNFISHIRRKLFAKPPMVCPTADPELENRFIL